MNNKANENNITVNENGTKAFSESFALPSASTELTHIENDGVVLDKFQYRSTDKDGNIVIKSTNNLTTMRVVNAITFFANVGKLSNKAIAIECGDVTIDIAKSEGYKTPAEMLHCIFPDLSHNTINQYKRVGKFFGIREKDENGKVLYRWRAGIDETVSVTNLTQVISLAKLPDNFEKLTKEEIDKLYSEFYGTYIESGKINLNLSQSDLKKQIQTVNSDSKAIEGEFTEKTDKKEEKSDNKETTAKQTEKSDSGESVPTETPKKSASEAILLLSAIFKSNTRVLKWLSQITEEIKKLPDVDAISAENSENSESEQ